MKKYFISSIAISLLAAALPALAAPLKEYPDNCDKMHKGTSLEGRVPDLVRKSRFKYASPYSDDELKDESPSAGSTRSTVYDTETHLTWRRCFNDQNISSKWYCHKSTADYFQNIKNPDPEKWRVPTIKELSTIMQTNCTLPAMNSDIFRIAGNNVTPNDVIFSSTFTNDFIFVYHVNDAKVEAMPLADLPSTTGMILFVGKYKNQ